MEDEYEDIIGDLRLTGSQKSVATSNAYSPDFTDSSPDRNNSSGKNTYTIERDDSETEPFELRSSKSVVNLSIHKHDKQCDVRKETNKTVAAGIYNYSYVSQEIFTQTSKTIFELAEMERKKLKNKTLETQTSLMSVKSKIVEYSIKVSNNFISDSSPQERKIICNSDDSLANGQILNSSLDDGSSKFPISRTENSKIDDDISSGPDEIAFNMLDGVKEIITGEEPTENQYETTSEFTSSNSDMEEDSLVECSKRKEENDSHSNTSEVPKSVDNDVEELYNKLSESIDLHNLERFNQSGRNKFGLLTPLTEESTNKDYLMDITPNLTNIVRSIEKNEDVLFASNTGTKVKILPKEELKMEKPAFKLPPLPNRSCTSSPYLNFLFNDPRPLVKTGTLPSVFEGQNENYLQRWEVNEELASGESTHIGRMNDPSQNTNEFYLPPIHIEGGINVKVDSRERRDISPEPKRDPISVKQKIRDLKMNRIATNSWMQGKHNPSLRSRNASPSSGSPSRSQDDSSFCEAAARGCEALCAELVRRLRLDSWTEIVNTLEELPRALEKFWGVITEQRIADLIRHVCTHVESPRTQVARTACDTLASILKATNYTKKPDFYEAVSILLMKTGSFSRPVRRAANVALDSVVCGVELNHAVTAICVHGVDHKSPLVRCATSRLLVVSCALAGGGRHLLRARPQSAVSARKHVLQALATFLCDKNTETRKYAERLYSMLRPLPNFEAYYLTDVDVEVATRQMKKYDQLLLCGPSKNNR